MTGTGRSGESPAAMEGRLAALVRRMGDAGEHLGRTLERARAAVQRAHQADHMTTPGVQNTVSDAEPAGARSERAADDADDADDADGEQADDRT